MEIQGRSEMCGICGENAQVLRYNLTTLKTKFSGTTVFQLLERFSERELSHQETTCTKSGVCSECFKKLNDYDAAYTKALIIQQELTDLLKNNTLHIFDDPHDPWDENVVEEKNVNISWMPHLEGQNQHNKAIKTQDDKDFKGLSTVRVAMKCNICGDVFRNISDMKNHTHAKADESTLYTKAPTEQPPAPVPSLVISPLKIETLSLSNDLDQVETLDEEPDESSEAVDDDENLFAKYYISCLDEGKTEAKDVGENVAQLFECLYCDSVYDMRQQLKEHLILNHAQHTGDHRCKVCGLATKTRAALVSHFGKHVREPDLVCTVCKKAFAQKAALQRHMAIHTGEKAYQCDLCGKQYVHYSSFYMHQLAHKDIRKKRCTICGFTLRSNSHLQRHMRTHSGEKPFSCPQCDQKFSQRYNMLQHLKSHPGTERQSLKVLKCPHCELSYERKTQLKKHLLKEHGADEPVLKSDAEENVAK